MTRREMKETETQSPEKGQVLLYKSKDGKSRVEVNLQNETVWLSQAHMCDLFEKNKRTISEHIRNIFREGELQEDSVVRKFRTTAADGKTYSVTYYDLDVIISIGYRVKSLRGTQFRIWATNVLREHLVEGYTLNRKRLQAQSDKIRELQKAIRMIDQIADHKALASDEASELIRIIRDYAYGLDLIDAYDHQRVDVSDVSEQGGVPLDYQAARQAIGELRRLYQAGDLFGREKDDSFQGSLANVFQTYDKQPLYPSIEEKAASLLYFLVRNHPFVDGNKRIAAFMFLWFLEKNQALYRPDQSKRIADNALVALTLMVAESKPQEKDLIVNMTVNLINKRNV